MQNAKWVVTGKIASWVNADGSLSSGPVTSPDLAAWLAAGNAPSAADPPPLSNIAFAAFLGRWTDAEYAILMQKRAQAIGAGNVTLVRQWDMAMANGAVDLGSSAATAFKAAIVAAAILTQARADAIFV